MKEDKKTNGKRHNSTSKLISQFDFSLSIPFNKNTTKCDFFFFFKNNNKVR